jgi:tetratricopeptide (TPR) repeat protein
MSDFEFWKDLGNIFDAILNYQKKNVEFNNRFINPWIRLGNIFDRDDQHKEAVQAYKHAIELDPDNAQNWADLGDVLFKMAAYDDAVIAYQKAVQLDPAAGWPISNLALTLVSQGKCEDAIPLFLTSIELLKEDKDKAVSWNRLGNTYRKLNDYENAFLAFQNADELDGENTGFHDQLDETTETTTMVAPEEVLVQMSIDQAEDVSTQVFNEETVETIAQAPQLEAEVIATDSTESVITLDLPNEPIAIAPNMEMVAEEVAVESSEPVAVEEAAPVVEEANAAAVEEEEPLPAWITEENASADEEDVEENIAEEIVEEPVLEEAQAETETIDEPVAQIIEEVVAWSKATTVEEPTEISQEVKVEEEANVVEAEAVETEPVEETPEVMAEVASNTSSTSMEMVETYTEFVSTAVAVPYTLEDTQPIKVVRVETVIELSSVSKEKAEETAAQPEVQEEAGEATQKTAVVKESAPVAESAEAQESSSAPTTEAPYEEYLKDAIEPVSTLSDHLEDVHGETPVTRVSESGDVRIAMDTENAHVWNELGNVYFNSGACDDAIAAYGKAIELDRQFAWPYSNLALAYVQKSRFAEAILLYQRSIELFTADKDKAVTWNRLGNVYRRLNDYSNAIAAYQTADDLDPDNASVSLRSHYGLLGNLYMDQKPNYVS